MWFAVRSGKNGSIIIEPRGRREREAHVEAFVVVEPALNAGMLVRSIAVADQTNLLVCGDGLVNQAKKSEPVLKATPLLAEYMDKQRIRTMVVGGQTLSFRPTPWWP
jgi:hypothetical protein